MTRQGDESAAGAVMKSSDEPMPRISDEYRRRATTHVLRRFGTWTDTSGEHATPESAEMLLALFCTTPSRHGKRPAPPAAKAIQVDPAHTQHPPEDIGAFRAQVCEWGRADGRGPDANSKRPLEPSLVDAYRLAHPERDRPRTGPGGPLMMPTAHIDDGHAARDVRTRMREFGRANGMPVSKRGPVGPELAAAYYAAHPEEAL